MNGRQDSLPCSVNHELNMRKVNINYATEKLRDVALASHRNDTLNRGVSKEKVLRSIGEERRGEERRGEERRDCLLTLLEMDRKHILRRHILGVILQQNGGGKAKRKKLF